MSSSTIALAFGLLGVALALGFGIYAVVQLSQGGTVSTFVWVLFAIGILIAIIGIGLYFYLRPRVVVVPPVVPVPEVIEMQQLATAEVPIYTIDGPPPAQEEIIYIPMPYRKTTECVCGPCGNMERKFTITPLRAPELDIPASQLRPLATRVVTPQTVITPQTVVNPPVVVPRRLVTQPVVGYPRVV